MGKQRYKAEEVVAALEEAGGVVVQAANILACEPRTIYNYADRYVTVKQALRETRSNTYAEGVGFMVALMRDREHKDHYKAVEKVTRVYGETVNDGLDWADKERQEHTGPDGGPMRTVNVNIDLKDFEETDDPEELQRLYDEQFGGRDDD